MDRALFPLDETTIQLTLRDDRDVPAGMVWVPASVGTSPAPPVELPGYWIDAYEVSNREFKKFVDAGGYSKKEFWTHAVLKDGRELSWPEAMDEFRDLSKRPGPSGWQLGTYPEGADDLPVGGVSWYEAAAYAEFAGKSLPTVVRTGTRPPSEGTWASPTSCRRATSATGDLVPSERGGAWPDSAVTTWLATSRNGRSTCATTAGTFSAAPGKIPSTCSRGSTRSLPRIASRRWVSVWSDE